MKLSPAEILRHLGFDIPDEGVEINPNDAYLIVSAIRLAGETINADHIPDDKLTALHQGMAGIVSGWVEQGLIAPLPVKEEPESERSLLQLRETVKALLEVHFKRRRQ